MSSIYHIEQNTFIQASYTNKKTFKKSFEAATFKGLSVVTFQGERDTRGVL